MAARTKLVEITLRVRVPKNWSVSHARREVAGAWYGEIYSRGPPHLMIGDPGADPVLRPKWGKARLIKES